MGADQPADEKDGGERQKHGEQNGGNAADPEAPQQVHDRSEHEGEQHREGDRNQHLAAEVKRRHRDHTDHDRQQSLQGRDVGGNHPGWRRSGLAVGHARHVPLN